ncbi:MAG: hypothetical protein ACK5ME_13170 [Parahaliea sp.]
MTATTGDLPCLDRLTERIESLNHFVAKRALRRYQLDILSSGTLSLPSPWTGREVQVDGCFFVNISPLGFGHIVIAYHLPCEQSLWLLSGIVREGFPLHALYCSQKDETLWDIHPEEQAAYAPVRAALQRFDEAGVPASHTASSQAPVLVVGHPNFAHNLWNELAGLSALSGLAPKVLERSELLLLCEPLTALDSILADSKPIISRLEQLDQLLGWHQRLLTRVGSTRISRALLARLHHSLCRHADPQVLRPLTRHLAGHWPVIWLTVRTDARTASNQDMFILALLTQISERYPNVGFVIDGFSYPDDFDNPLYQDSDPSTPAAGSGEFVVNSSLQASLKSREHIISRYIARLQKKLKARGIKPVISASGLRMVDTVALAARADYYVCHAGTLQHKIAWLYDTPGIVHSNKEGLCPAAGQWMANQVEKGREPVLVNADLVEDLASIRTLAQAERNRDYRFIDVDAVVEQVLDAMSQRLSAGKVSDTVLHWTAD